MQIIGLIPARSGSKGLVNKNIIDFKGKPLIAHSIQASNDSRYINRTIVSTDSQKYADIAIEYKAEVPFIRPKDIAGDFVQDSEVFIHLINTINLDENDIVVQLRPTNPLREIGLIDEVITKMIKNNLPAIRTLSKSKFSPYKMVTLDSNTIRPLLNIEGKKFGTDLPRQLLPETYELNGNVDAFFVSSFIKYKSFFPEGTGYFIQKEATAEIDHQDDLTKLSNETKH